MKLSQLLHTLDNSQVISITEFNSKKASPIMRNLTRKDIPKHSDLNVCNVRNIKCENGVLYVSISIPDFI